jgi:hypothetical protein
MSTTTQQPIAKPCAAEATQPPNQIVRVHRSCVGDAAYWIWARLPLTKLCGVVAMCKEPRQAIALLEAGYPGCDEVWVSYVSPVSKMSWDAWTKFIYPFSVGITLEVFQNHLVEMASTEGED